MTKQTSSQLPTANIVHSRGIPFVWIIPISVLFVGAWLVYQNFAERGPRIVLLVSNAEGITAGKTSVRYRNVEIGKVRELQFTKDLKRVVMEIDLNHGTEPWLNEKTRFWVVKPQVGLQGVSGLGTLFSGNYIGMEPGDGRESQREFTALKKPPTLLSGEPGSQFRLRSPTLGSLAIGSPVYFRQIPVGEVINFRIADNHRYVELDVFVRAPHDKYVQHSSRFWNVSGFDFD